MDISAEVLDLIPIACYHLNHTGEITYINQHALKLFSMGRDDCLGRNVFDIFRKDKGLGYFSVIELALSEGKTTTYDYISPIIHRWIGVTAVPTSRGVVVSFTDAGIDLTTWKNAEAALTNSEQLYKTSYAKYLSLFESIDQGFCIIELLFDENGKANDYRFLEMNPAFGVHTGLHNAIGKTIRSLAPEHEAHWYQIYSEVAATGIPRRFEEKAEALERWFDVYAFGIDLSEKHQVAVLFNDITERKSNEEKKEFLLRLSDAVRPLGDSADIQLAAMHVLGEHLKITCSQFYEAEESGEYLISAGGAGDGTSPVIQRVRMDDFGSYVKEAFRAGLTLAVADISRDSRISPDELKVYEQLGFRSFVGVPLVKDGRFVAGLVLYNTTARKWLASDLAIAEETAERVWAAVERAKAETALRIAEERYRNHLEREVADRTRELNENYALVRKMEVRQQHEIFRVTLNTQEEERRRISESLHNGLAQLLYGTKLSLNNLMLKTATEKPDKFIKSRNYTDQLLTEAIKETRRISHELMPTVLAEFGLSAAIQEICDQLQGDLYFNCSISVGKMRLDNYLELAVFRTVQELMINVVKHAQATHATVGVTAKNNMVEIRVHDNGQGMSAEPQDKPGIGLSSIRNKVALLKGRISINATPGAGTVVEVDFPIHYSKKI